MPPTKGVAPGGRIDDVKQQRKSRKWGMALPSAMPSANCRPRFSVNNAEMLRMKRNDVREEMRIQEQIRLEDQEQHNIAMAKRREKKFTKMYNGLQEDQAGLVSRISGFFENKDAKAKQARRSLYGEWNAKVFSRIQEKVDEQLQTIDAKELTNKRAQIFQSFLRYTNEGGGSYLDIYDKQRYNPFEWRKRYLQAPRRTDLDTEDPVKRDLLKQMAGRSIRSKLGSQKPRERRR